MPFSFAKTNEEFNRACLVASMISTSENIGAIVTFYGRVRKFNHQKEVISLHYEAHESLAQSLFKGLVANAQSRFLLIDAQAVHRLGQVHVGEDSVFIAARARHRNEAFLAARYLIDELKAKLPIWKKEIYADQSFAWDRGDCACANDLREIILAPAHKALRAQQIDDLGLASKKVLIVGAGGLACPLAIGLAGAGVKELSIVDGDVVRASNLARQFVYKLADEGRLKVEVLKSFLAERFPFVHTKTHSQFADQRFLQAMHDRYDLLLDLSDCFRTKTLLKEFAYDHQLPLISASVHQQAGDVQCFVPKSEACLNCFWPKNSDDQGSFSCASLGVLSHICMLVAALATQKALQILAGLEPKGARIAIVDAKLEAVKSIELKKIPIVLAATKIAPQKAAAVSEAIAMITYEEAISLIEKNPLKLKVIKKPTHESLKSFLAEDLFSPIDLPPFDNSAVDGFALKSKDLEHSSCLAISSLIRAQKQEPFSLPDQCCSAITTGAPMPLGADAVAMKEDVEVEAQMVHFGHRPQPKENLRFKGEDLRQGDLIAKAGTHVNAQLLALISAAGIAEINVFADIRVAIIVSGDEIVEPGQSLAFGEVYHVLGPMLKAQCQALGINDVQILKVPDQNSSLIEAIKQALNKGVDLLLMMGGMSKGEYDLVRPALAHCEVQQIFFQGAFRPGKPTYFGKFKETRIFGIPGNPAAAFICFWQFVRPLIYGSMGASSYLRMHKAIAQNELSKKTGLHFFARVFVDEEQRLFFLPNQGSHQLSSLSKANGIAVIQAQTQLVKAFEIVHYFPLD